MPNIRKILDKEIEKSGMWLPRMAGEFKFEVSHMNDFSQKFVIDLEAQSCSCNFWELVGIPCKHAVSAIYDKGHEPGDYVNKYYRREAYEKCYRQMVSPINGECMWPPSEHEPILPPKVRTPQAGLRS